ncbi:DUF4189 domain-containing protein [Mongoliimonas terrestris]|uniref:DUF4189 domain-containing protein n=1 Tax=Mongoliimonas terrestris TaxID=1709001 RepID=UPI000949B12E|nr:DUF4189 domain-containing protein [Mongoliimonas terrestris]
MRFAFRGAVLAAVLAATTGQALAIGAIAVNDSRGTSAEEAGWGLGWGVTRREAERDAKEQCLDAGNDTCTIAVWFETCGAYAGSRTYYGIGYGNTKRKAEAMALENCPNCQVIVSDCE